MFTNLKYYEPAPKNPSPVHIKADLCIYGGTSAGVAAAVQAARMGLRSVIVEFSRHLGGMTASGLGATDIGNKGVIGGISREFYRAVGENYPNHPNKDTDGSAWTFEPHVATKVFQDWIDQAGVEVYFQQHLAAVDKANGRIRRITMENGNIFEADMFIDATYEGDLLARAGISYHVGREGNTTYKETLNGVHFGSPYHNFQAWVDPYVIPGKPESGLLSGINDDSPGYQGRGDVHVQAYNFRICLTKVAENRLPFPKPPNYDPSRFELLARYIEAGVWDALRLHLPMPNGKTDLNNFGGFSTDHIGMADQWPDGDYRTRESLFQDHLTYNLGMLYFLSNDDRVPVEIRKEVSQWGLPMDEFELTGGWPHQLYIREGRRMISDVVMTEQHCRGLSRVEDSVGMAAYGIDSHNCRRIVIDGRVINEGNVEIPVPGPYPISYRSIVPKADECTNLFVPIALSASHIAFGSIRMEPVFMVLGQSAATAAALALQEDASVQDVDYKALERRLIADGQILN